ncbi:MAG: hypothetical protein HYS24_08770 [Ignavibacteriales bacterium]|nr:hypothetical protein [Ignavibacteriales bacterium]
MESKKSAYIVLFFIVVGIAFLIFASYETGYKKSKNSLGSLLMTMRMDSNFVYSGLYEEMSDNVRKTVQFYSADSPTLVNNVKIFAEVKYIMVGNEVINVDNGAIWNLIKNEKIFKRRFKEKDDDKKSEPKNKKVPNSQLALK